MFCLDIHTHTAAYSPCSISDPVAHLRQAATAGLDGLCITEHDRLWPEGEWRALERDARRLGLLLLPGQEIRCMDEDGVLLGDYLVFGPEISINRPLLPAELIELIHERKGIVIAAHPYRAMLGAGDRINELPLDGVEVYHPRHDKPGVEKAQQVADRRGLAQTGASDAHRSEDVGTFGTHFTEPVTRLEDLVLQIRDRLTTPVCKIPGWPEEPADTSPEP